MESIKEQYWRYSLIAIIIGVSVILFFEATPFLGGILGAFTIYILLRKQMFYLTEQMRIRPSIAASLLLGETIGAAHPGMMNDADWQGYGRAFDMMYALALGGETRSFRVTGNAFSTYASVAKAFEAGRGDSASQGMWLAAAVRGCALMEAAGYKAMAEYFRASLCLNVVDFSKSGKMLANAKWHLDRAAELNGTLTAEQRAEYPNDFADYRQQYQQYLRRYGKAMEAQLKAGQLPDLAGEYPAGTAPAPQSCALFMKDIEALQSGAPLPGAPKKKGFFGLFG